MKKLFVLFLSIMIYSTAIKAIPIKKSILKQEALDKIFDINSPFFYCITRKDSLQVAMIYVELELKKLEREFAKITNKEKMSNRCIDDNYK